MRDAEIHAVLRLVKRECRKWEEPIVGAVAKESQDPFQILIACVLSLRTKDQTTAAASQRLFALARDPTAMLKLSLHRLEQAIYPVGFYRNKAKHIRLISQTLLSEFHGRVPDTIEDLLTLKGVGRKTANLVVTVGFKKSGICVDVHVHRICNRWGYIRTKIRSKPNRFCVKSFLAGTGLPSMTGWCLLARTFANPSHPTAVSALSGGFASE